MKYISQAIGSVLSFFDSFLGSYLLAILLFALLVKVVMLPFGIYQQKNMQKQASLRPKEAAIRKKYKGRENDREALQKMQAEINEMYRANKYNMFGGCLPLLIQLPIILFIYNIIISPLSYISRFSDTVIENIQKFIGQNPSLFGIAESAVKDGVYGGSQLDIASLLNNPDYLAQIAGKVEGVELTSNIPNFSLFGLNLGERPSLTSLLILIPILVFVSQFLSMKLTRRLNPQPLATPDQGCANNIMDIGMPVMTAFLSLGFPALLGIYWIFQNLIGMLQQFILKLIFPFPKFTEEDYKNAERALRGKEPKGQRNFDTKKKYRSLHNIDADDDEPGGQNGGTK